MHAHNKSVIIVLCMLAQLTTYTINFTVSTRAAGDLIKLSIIIIIIPSVFSMFANFNSSHGS